MAIRAGGTVASRELADANSSDIRMAASGDNGSVAARHGRGSSALTSGDGAGGGSPQGDGSGGNGGSGIRPEFTAQSQSVYVFDNIPVVLKRFAGSGYSHSIEKHAPWSNNDSRHDSSSAMFNVKKLFIENNLDGLKALADPGRTSGSNRLFAKNVEYNNESYTVGFEFRDGKFYEVTSYKNRR